MRKPQDNLTKTVEMTAIQALPHTKRGKEIKKEEEKGWVSKREREGECEGEKEIERGKERERGRVKKNERERGKLHKHLPPQQ